MDSTTEKILKCQYENEWNGFKIITLPIEDIWQSVVSVDTLSNGKPFKKTLLDDIKNNGMHFPIMVVHTSYSDLLKAKDRWKNKICELPFWHNTPNPENQYIWSVWGGSQRLDVAKRLAYTHIDCVHIPNIDKAISLQKEMRKPFFDKYYK